MLEPLQIGPVRLQSPVLLAPMAGVTDLPFRRRAQAMGAPYVVSEMVAGDQLACARRDMVRRAAGAGIVTAARRATGGTRGPVDGPWRPARRGGWRRYHRHQHGSPSKSVTGGQSGSALMRDPDRALRLIEATVAATARPVTLKMRLGWDATTLNAPQIARRAEAAGVQMIVVHGRTRCQFFRDAADWSGIRATVEAVRIPVIANGDIATADDARRALALSGAAGVMIGRAAQGQPWRTAAVARALLAGGREQMPTLEAIGEALLALYEDTLSFYGVELGLRIARKHIAWTIDAHAPLLDADMRRTVRADICRMTSPQEVTCALRQIFGEDERREAA